MFRNGNKRRNLGLFLNSNGTQGKHFHLDLGLEIGLFLI